MNSSHLRAQAREVLTNSPGIYTLFLAPIALSLSSVILSFFKGGDLESIQTLSADLNTAGLINLYVSSTSFSLTLNLILSLFLASISFRLLEWIRREAESLSFKDSLRGFQSDWIGKLLPTILVKEVLLLCWRLLLILASLFFWGGLVFLGVFAWSLEISGQSQQLSLIMTQSFEQVPHVFESSDSLLGASPALAALALLASIPLGIVGMLVYIPQHYAYSQTEWVLYDQIREGRYQGPLAAIKESRRLVKGHKWQRFVLDLSFLGWDVLTILTGGLLGIYTIPYKQISATFFYQELRHSKKAIH